MIDSKTQNLCIAGKSSGTHSPHHPQTPWHSAAKINMVYIPFLVGEAASCMSSLKSARALNMLGLNVTVPP